MFVKYRVPVLNLLIKIRTFVSSRIKIIFSDSKMHFFNKEKYKKVFLKRYFNTNNLIE